MPSEQDYLDLSHRVEVTEKQLTALTAEHTALLTKVDKVFYRPDWASALIIGVFFLTAGVVTVFGIWRFTS